MSFKKPSARPLQHHLSSYFITVSAMRRDGWVVMARCRACHLDAWVCLSTVIRLNGPDVQLFGRTTRCRRYGCQGRMIFMATPPGAQHGQFWPLLRPQEPKDGSTPLS